MTAKTTAERVKALRERREAEGLVRLEIFITEAQREKLAKLGGAAWVRSRIDKAKLKGTSDV